MTRKRRFSPQTSAVLGVLADQPSEWFYGLELSKLTELKSGSLYPILIRLADRGLLQSRWLEPSEEGRPPRHVYRITSAGLTAFAEAQCRFHLSLQELRI